MSLPRFVKERVTHLYRDIRYGLRTFTRAPGFTAVAIAVLALGIGANSAVFSVVNGLMFSPLSGRAGELVGVYSRDTTKPDRYRPFSYPNYVDIRDRSGVFDALLAHTFATVGVRDGETTRRTFVGVVSSNYFDTLGVRLAAGRPFNAAEERPNARIPVVVASYGAWKAKGLDPAFVGSTMRINALDFTVVGVAPLGFTGTMAVAAPDLWLPLGVFDTVVNNMFNSRGTGLGDRANGSLIVAGRLKPGLAPAAIAARLEGFSAELERAYPAENRNQVLTTATLPRLGSSTRPSTDAEIIPVLALLMGLCGVVLFIACLNIANMLLARGASRRKEIAVRLAIGANRSRVVRQLLAEGLVLAMAGAAAGLLLSWWAMRALTASMVTALPLTLTLDPTPDMNVIVATTAFAMLSTVLFGLGPALRLSRRDLVSDLKEVPGDRGSMGGWLTGRNLLVVGQIALSLALLIAGGLFARATIKAAASDPGFRYEGALLASLDASLAELDEARGRAVYRDILARVRALPGVQAVGSASTVPFGDTSEGRMVEAIGSAQPPRGQAVYRIVTADYFKALGLQRVRGREFTNAEEESADAPAVAMVDEAAARLLFPGRDPIGESIRFTEGEDSTAPRESPLQVVGIAPAIREEVTERAIGPHVYVAYGRHYRQAMHLHVKLAPGADTSGTLAAIRREVTAVEPRLPILELTTMGAFHEKSLVLWLLKAGGTMFSLLGLLALVLAVVGVYGVKSYIVSSRTREIGVRMALGADRSDVLWLFLREGLALTGAGLSIGIPLAIAISFVLSSVMWGFTRFDLPVFLGAPALLAATAMIASYIPARRATKIAPLRALRTE